MDGSARTQRGRQWPGHPQAFDATRSGAGWRWLVVVACAVIMVGGTIIPAQSAQAAPLSAPTLTGPIGRSDTTIGVRFWRVAESKAVCQDDIGYEVKGGPYAEWHDVGGFPHAPCDDPDPGYKFSGLEPSTTYRLSVRAYRIVDGDRTDFSPASSITATTLAAGPSPTAPGPVAPPTPAAPPAAPGQDRSFTGFVALVAGVGVLVLLAITAWVRRRLRASGPRP